MKLPIRMKRIGWVGIIDGHPHFEDVIDDYSGSTDFKAVNVYRSKKEARKRYQSILPVYIPTLERKK